GGTKLAAPQASLMASLSQGIVGGDMPWPLVGAGVMMGIALIMMQVKSPMLISVGMYLPLATTFAIFVGGMIRRFTDARAAKLGYNENQLARVANIGILIASGLITGESLMGLVEATFSFYKWPIPEFTQNPSYTFGAIFLVVLAAILVYFPLANPGRPDEP